MRKFYYVELLRFFSALSVLIYHYQHFFKPHSTFSSIDVLQEKFIQPFYSYLEILYNYGSYGVPMFWSISGFVFAFVYLGRQKDITGKKFFINRFSRLYPLHFATLIIVALLQIVNYKFSGSFQIYALNDIYHFFLNLFFISGWGFEKGYSFNAPIWSVSIELIIYMLFFFTIINLNRYKVKFALLIYLLLLIVDKTEIAGGDESVIALFVACGKLFYSGVIVFLLYEKVEGQIYHPGKSSSLRLGKNMIAKFGEIHPILLKIMDINFKVFGFEIFLDNLTQFQNKKSSTKGSFDNNPYQMVERDFAFLFDKNVKANEIINKIKKIDKKIINKITIFDVYEGDKLPDDKKSIALRVLLQPQEKTFTDEEIENISKKIIDLVTTAFEATLR